MAVPTVFLFSGQGSQYYQMGRELFEQDPTFRSSMLHFDSIVREDIGVSILDTLYDNAHTRAQPFDQIVLSYPAIFMVEYSLAQMLIRRGIRPDLTLAVSMGSFAAAAVAGCFSPEDALANLLAQAKLIEAHCPRGAMIAVLGEASALHDPSIEDNCEIAAENAPGNFVVAAPQERVSATMAHFKELGFLTQSLPVSYPFHSRWIDPMKDKMLSVLASLQSGPARISMICCVDATRIESLPPDHLWKVARRRIMLARTVQQLEQTGTYRYVDVGPSGTLATILKYVLPKTSDSSINHTLTPFGRDLRQIDALAPA
jgi:acyl transferase domain-containing protein